MEDTIDDMIIKGKEAMSKSLDHLSYEFTKIRAGKATPDILNGIIVDYYGSPTSINQVANITASDSRTLSVQPWEKKMLGVIEKAIFEANLGITPMNDGETIRLSIPPLTEERRKDLAKQAKACVEEAKIAIRTNRQKLMDFIKKEVKNGFAEDMGKRKEGEVEDLVKHFSSKAESLFTAKEAEIMKV